MSSFVLDQYKHLKIPLIAYGTAVDRSVLHIEDNVYLLKTNYSRLLSSTQMAAQ